MTCVIHDPEVHLLATIAATLMPDYADKNVDWQNSPFGWIRVLPSRRVGAIGEALVAGWCAAKGLDVARSPDSEADRVVNGLRIEIKFSTLWHSGVYKFQQLRDQNYDAVICLGLSPFDAHCWVIPKPIVIGAWGRVSDLRTQHAGRAGRDTAWLSVRPESVPGWLQAYGGTLANAFEALQHLLPRTEE